MLDRILVDASPRGSPAGAEGVAMIGGGIGLIGGLGLVLVAAGLARRRLTLLDRVSPYVRPSVQVSRLLVDGRSRSLGERIVAPIARDLGRAFETIGSTASSVQRRLRQAGSSSTVEVFALEDFEVILRAAT